MKHLFTRLDFGPRSVRLATAFAYSFHEIVMFICKNFFFFDQKKCTNKEQLKEKCTNKAKKKKERKRI